MHCNVFHLVVVAKKGLYGFPNVILVVTVTGLKTPLEKNRQQIIVVWKVFINGFWGAYPQRFEDHDWKYIKKCFLSNGKISGRHLRECPRRIHRNRPRENWEWWRLKNAGKHSTLRRTKIVGWNITIFNRKYIFKGTISHCYVSLRECIWKVNTRTCEVILQPISNIWHRRNWTSTPRIGLKTNVWKRTLGDAPTPPHPHPQTKTEQVAVGRWIWCNLLLKTTMPWTTRSPRQKSIHFEVLPMGRHHIESYCRLNRNLKRAGIRIHSGEYSHSGHNSATWMTFMIP